MAWKVSCWALLLNVVSSWLRGAVCRSAALDHTQFSGHENTFTNIGQLEVIFRVAQEKEVQMVSFPACAAVRVDEHETITNDRSQVVFGSVGKYTHSVHGIEVQLFPNPPRDTQSMLKEEEDDEEEEESESETTYDEMQS